MCCVGGQDGVQVENRMASVETYLDNFVDHLEMAHLHNQETNDERNRIKKEETNQGLGVTIEIHPPARKTVYNSIHNVEDEIDDKAKVETKRVNYSALVHARHSSTDARSQQDTDKEKHQESPERERGTTKMKDQTSDSEVV